MQENREQEPVASAGDSQGSLNQGTQKNTRNDRAGEPLEGSGFENEIPEPGFEWQE